MNLSNNFSDFAFIERKARKLTQIEMCKLTGLSRSTYSKIECDGEQVTINNMEKVLMAHNLTLKDFVLHLEKVNS